MYRIGDTLFHWADYLVFAVSLALSLGIGVYYAIVDRRKQNNEDFLMAGRSLSIGPVTASTFATLVSCMVFIAFPVEVYYFGVGYMFIPLGVAFSIIPIAEFIAPAFHRMNLVSAFQYLEETYNAKIRKAASALQMCVLFFYMGMMTYAPAMTLAQVSGITPATGMVLTCTVCTLYTTIGGMRAVVWSDTLQMILMFIGVIILVFKAFADLGGFKEAFEIINKGERSTYLNWHPDPFTRSGVWGYLIGGFFTTLVSLTSNQMAIQRYCTLPTVREVKISLYLIIPMYALLCLLVLLLGFAMYANFSTCDPLAGQMIDSIDQMVPFVVMRVLGPWPGMSGLFVASVFAAALSSLSSGQNAMAAVILSDFIEPLYLKRKGSAMPPKMSFTIAKGLVFVVGLLTLMMAFLVLAMGGDLFALVYKFIGILAGPIAGLFSLAIMFTSIKRVEPVLTGFLVASAVGLFMGVGGQFFKMKPDILPISIENCTHHWSMVTNNFTYLDSSIVPTASPLITTMSTIATTPAQKEGIKFFSLNPLYYSLIGYCVTIAVAYITDRLMKYCANEEGNNSESKYSRISYNKMGDRELITIQTTDKSIQTAYSVPPEATTDILWEYDDTVAAKTLKYS